MNNNNYSFSFLLTKMISVLILSLSIVFSGYYFANKYYESHRTKSYVEVKGSSETIIDADFVSWNIPFMQSGANLNELQEHMKTDTYNIKELLKKNQLTEDDFSVMPLLVVDRNAQNYTPAGNYSVDNRYTLKQNIIVRTNKLTAVQNISNSLPELINKGVLLSNGSPDRWGTSPEFYFTSLSKIKPQMLAEAIQNTKKAALKFAQNSDTKLGKLVYAKQGLFSITPYGGSMTSFKPTSVLKKTVRVIVNAKYEITNR